MSIFKLLLVSLFSLFFSVTITAQTETEEDPLSLNSGSIDNQFEFIIQRSNSYQEFKVVKKDWLYTLKAHTLDSIKAVKTDLENTQAIVENQNKEITTLKTSLADTKNTLAKTNDEKDNMALFGLQMSKTSYNIVMWAIVFGLLILLSFFIYKFKNSNSTTREAKKALAEIEEEFDEHRKVALEREQKVRRQLQDELNKQKS